MSISGKYLGAKVGTLQILGVAEWEVDDKVDELDATVGNSAANGGGFSDTDAGVQDLTGTMKILFDMTSGGVSALGPGFLITNLNLYRNLGDATPAFNIPVAIIVGRPFQAQVRGRLEVTCKFKNKGSYFYSDGP